MEQQNGKPLDQSVFRFDGSVFTIYSTDVFKVGFYDLKLLAQFSGNETTQYEAAGEFDFTVQLVGVE